MDRKRFEVFMREKPAMLLIEMLNSCGTTTYAAVLAKSIDCTYSHVIRIVQEMEDSQLLLSNKQGRTKVLELTDKGQQVARHLEGIRTLL